MSERGRACLAEARESFRASEGGFTMFDLMVILGVVSVLFALGLPLLDTATNRLRFNQAVRDVERELQGAKQRAVATNRPIRVRFDCPSAGVYRAVELLGTLRVPSSLDTSTTRCDDTTYPYPAPDRDPMTRPNVDGQVLRLPSGITFGSVTTVEFWPDGTVHAASGSTTPWPPIASTGLTLTLTYASRTASIQVNGLGRITLATQ